VGGGRARPETPASTRGLSKRIRFPDYALVVSSRRCYHCGSPVIGTQTNYN